MSATLVLAVRLYAADLLLCPRVCGWGIEDMFSVLSEDF